ncbi:hypothetical protein ACVBEF_17280 [Glaciimonas sp. GG7]
MKNIFIVFVVTLLIVGSSYVSYDNYQNGDHVWYQIPSGGPD